MNYTIESIQLDKYHPYHPNQIVFVIGKELGRIHTYYLTHEAASEMLIKKIERTI